MSKKEETPIHFSKTNQSIMDKEKMDPLYIDEFGVICFIPIFFTFVFGSFFHDFLQFGPGAMYYFGASLAVDAFLIRFFIKSKETAPPNYILQLGYTFFNGLSIGPLKNSKRNVGAPEDRMSHYNSVKKSRRYSN